MARRPVTKFAIHVFQLAPGTFKAVSKERGPMGPLGFAGSLLALVSLRSPARPCANGVDAAFVQVEARRVALVDHGRSRRGFWRHSWCPCAAGTLQ